MGVENASEPMSASRVVHLIKGPQIDCFILGQSPKFFYARLVLEGRRVRAARSVLFTITYDLTYTRNQKVITDRKAAVPFAPNHAHIRDPLVHCNSCTPDSWLLPHARARPCKNSETNGVAGS
jgi:hypothetical protein